jgi:hypothetical protein
MVNVLSSSVVDRGGVMVNVLSSSVVDRGGVMVNVLSSSVVDRGGVMVYVLSLSVVDHRWCNGQRSLLEWLTITPPMIYHTRGEHVDHYTTDDLPHSRRER